jgi:hypothetical protein
VCVCVYACVRMCVNMCVGVYVCVRVYTCRGWRGVRGRKTLGWKKGGGGEGGVWGGNDRILLGISALVGEIG